MKDLVIKRAVISVADKSNLLPLAKCLIDQGVEIISTGGTAAFLNKANIPTTSIESITGKPEAFDGRMKSISFELSSSLLFRRGHAQDELDRARLGIQAIDLVVCNLYPFEEVELKHRENAANELQQLVEHIDVGGPNMLRAAAKNFESVLALTDPNEYEFFINELTQKKVVSFEYRFKKAIKIFSFLKSYDEAISLGLMKRYDERFKREHLDQDTFELLKTKKTQTLRYGENPHQMAYNFPINNYLTLTSNDLAHHQHQGKELSYNNWLDMDQAYKCVSELHYSFSQKLEHAVIVKHGNPCCVYSSNLNSTENLIKAFEQDPTSAFGGVIAVNKVVTKAMAEWCQEHFFEVIVAPGFEKNALEMLAKKKNLRLIERCLKTSNLGEFTVRSVLGQMLYQEEDESISDLAHIDVKTKRKLFNVNGDLTAPTAELITFGLIVTKYLKSNAIGLFAQHLQEPKQYWLSTAGTGQPNRIDCLTKLAIPRALEKGVDLKKVLLVSDAFFPFDDFVRAASKAGIQYIVAPGGSIRDDEVILAADELKIALGFTKQRHFRH